MLRVFLALLVLIASCGQGFAFQADGTTCQSDLLALEEARQYMLMLINRDRLSLGLAPVELDPVASAAGQEHSDEMARFGYLSHLDLKGRKPEQRYSEVGGRGAVSENIAVNHDFRVMREKPQLAVRQLFSKQELERIEALFLNEKPPFDGHRQNILNPHHNKVGIGLTAVQQDNRVVCAQEFVNEWGDLAQLPLEHKRGQELAVTGKIKKGLSLHGIDVYREEHPLPLDLKTLSRTISYSLPAENVASYFPPPYRSASPVSVKAQADGAVFSVHVESDKTAQPGLYYIVVWVKRPDSSTPFVTSTRTVAVN